MNQLKQGETLAIQKLQTLRQLYLVKFIKQKTPIVVMNIINDRLCLQVKDDKPSVEGRKDNTVCPVNLETDQQRRMVTEQV